LRCSVRRRSLLWTIRRRLNRSPGNLHDRMGLP
jgi:hypothetical protein